MEYRDKESGAILDMMRVPGPDEMVAWGSLCAWLSSQGLKWRITREKAVEVQATTGPVEVTAGWWIVSKGSGSADFGITSDEVVRQYFEPAALAAASAAPGTREE